MDYEYFKTTLTQLISKEMKVDTQSLQPHLEFTQFGLDSVAAITISGELEDLTGTTLPTTLLWDFPSIHTLALYLSRTLSGGTSFEAPAA